MSGKQGAQPKGVTAFQVTLNNGMEMPLVGFGTAGLGRDTKQAVKWALEAGYRLLDSAQVCLGHPNTQSMSLSPSTFDAAPH